LGGGNKKMERLHSDMKLPLRPTLPFGGLMVAANRSSRNYTMVGNHDARNGT